MSFIDPAPLNKIIGYGLMGFTWRDDPVEDGVAFEAMREAVKMGAVHWSTCEFYGPKEDPLANIKLLKRYFEKYPNDAEKVQIYVKGCFDLTTFQSKCSENDILSSIQTVQNVLGDTKKIDYFGPARKDFNTPIEETMKVFKKLIEKGMIKGVFLSEVGAETIAKAQAIQPLSAIEVEFSIWSQDLLENGVAKVTKENNIPILAYSPLGRGLLTGQLKSIEQIPKGDRRLTMERFQGTNFEKNVELVNKIEEFARKIKCTPAQIALAWILTISDSEKAGTIIPIPGSSTASRVKENSIIISLTEEQFDQLNKIMPSNQVWGGRANKHVEHMMWA